MRLATLCLASCSGCHINLLSLQDEFLDLLAANDLVFSPILMDVKEPQACDLALIEGAVRTEEDAEKLRALRAKAQLLVAMGSCAVYGGIVGLGNAYENHELLKPAYENHPETTDHLESDSPRATDRCRRAGGLLSSRLPPASASHRIILEQLAHWAAACRDRFAGLRRMRAHGTR